MRHALTSGQVMQWQEELCSQTHRYNLDGCVDEQGVKGVRENHVAGGLQTTVSINLTPAHKVNHPPMCKLLP